MRTGGASYRARMVRKRSAFDPLKQSAGPHWHVVRSRQGALLESHRVAPGTDLKRLFVELILRAMDEGWEVGEFSSVAGTFFCDKYPDRRMVTISPTDPKDDRGSLYGPSPSER